MEELVGARRVLSKAISREEQRGKGEEVNKEEIARVARTVRQMMEGVERKLGI